MPYDMVGYGGLHHGLEQGVKGTILCIVIEYG